MAEISADDVEKLVKEISPFLAGKHPAIAGGVLAKLVSLWLAGHHPKMRGEVLEGWTETMLALMKINAEDFWDGERPRFPPDAVNKKALRDCRMARRPA